VTWWDAGRYSVRFRLTGSERGFSYRSKCGSEQVVEREISGAGVAPVRVLFQRTDREPRFWRDRVYDSVYEVEVGGRIVRSWSQVDQAIRADDRLAPWLALVFLLPGGYFAHHWLVTRDEAA
jgi:hypothetical protein